MDGETNNSLEDITYRALALQFACHSVYYAKNREESLSIIKASLERLDQQIAFSKAFIGKDCLLIVLPEYFLTGFPMGEPPSLWIEKACFQPDGPEYEALFQIAQRHQIYLSGNVYERDTHFPNLFFQTSFLIDPSGQIVLRYRRLNSMFTPSPHDVWDRYLEIYGLDGVFPVAKTPIGNFGAIASEEILFPEIARCLAIRGAEIFLHSNSQANEIGRRVKDAAAICRAVENVAYVISANSGGILGTPIPSSSASGGSKIVDYRGVILAETGIGESMTAFCEIDLRGLRQYRRRVGMENLLSRQRLDIYAENYQRCVIYPKNTLLNKIPDPSHYVETQEKVIKRLVDLGII
ncbi:MAG: nitrilase-related carbon-nitrogen hydrolase [Candidatus Anstonellales archaeon]